MADQFATTGSVIEYSGMLFNRGRVEHPFSDMIGGKSYNVNHTEFVVGQEYATADGTQPKISETASLTAPDASVVTRKQTTNVTQIFQYAVGISDVKRANMGTLGGINIAGQQGEPIDELAFQTAAVMERVKQDMEYTYINGKFHKSTGDDDANQTRGIVEAITTNVIDGAKKPLDIYTVADVLDSIQTNHAMTTGLTLGVSAKQLRQLQVSAIQNDMTIVPASNTVNGVAVTTLLTEFGPVNIKQLQYLPDGVALVLNMGVISNVTQTVPGKGNFYLEQLAKTGAGDKYQLFGMVGLDYGPEWYHGKITGLDTTFAHPKYTKTISMYNGETASGSTTTGK